MKRRCSVVLSIAAFVSNPFLSFGQEMIPVNGHALYVHCGGTEPGPTVILVAGGGGTTKIWEKVQPQISSFAKVCSYDRAGLGKSSAVERAQSADEVVNDLSVSLKTAHIQPPYLLVGHSIGGLYVRRYDERYDRQVSGIVLIDSAHEEQIWRFAKSEPEALSEYPDWKNQTAMNAQGFLPPGQRLSWSFAKPLVVIEHGIPPEPVWHRMQQDLAARAPDGKLITAIHSSHYVQLQQPELVIESIRTILRTINVGDRSTSN